MRFALAFCLLFVFGTANVVQAYYDDSVVIEIEGRLPPDPIPPGSPSGGSGSAGTSGGGGGTSGGGGGGSEGGGTLLGTAGGYLYGFEGTPWSGTLADIAALEDELYALLVAVGAISGTGVSNSNSVGGSGTGAGAGGIGGSGNISIDADKLRAALRENNSFRQILDDFGARARSEPYRKGWSQRDFGLMAAYAVLEDTNIDELTFGATKFEMVYRSRGYLIGFIPKTFPVRISVNPQASVASEKVVLKLPWYRFFIRKLFSPSVLTQEISAIVAADVRIEGDVPFDVQARLFEQTSVLLKQKIGTVEVSR